MVLSRFVHKKTLYRKVLDCLVFRRWGYGPSPYGLGSILRGLRPGILSFGLAPCDGFPSTLMHLKFPRIIQPQRI